MKPENKSMTQLSLKERQSALFKVLYKLTDELFEGTQKRLASSLHIDASTVSRWFKNQSCAVNPDGHGNDFQVIIHMIAIYRSLASIFANPMDRRAWFQAPNAHLQDRSPEEHLQSGLEGLLLVRQYLDFARGQAV